MRTIPATGLMLSLVLAPVFAQAPDPRPRFEAASVKPSPKAEPGIGGSGARAGRFDRSNAPAQFYVEQAYGLPSTRIVDAPDWLLRERFDITATYDPALVTSVPEMLQRLLEERFRLAVRRETREVAVYELLPLRADGQVPQLLASTANCSPAQGPTPCRMRIAPGLIDAIGMDWRGVPINLGVWDRPILDKTGLSGRYDIKLEWLPEPGLAGSPEAAARAASAATTAAADPAGRVSVFTALQEQLGLKLQPTGAPLEVLVIERVERPTPD